MPQELFSKYMGDGVIFYDVPFYLDSVAFTAMIPLTLLITVNRLTIFVIPRINDVIFTSKNTLM
ncbi:hypothetical protein KIN20_028546 [Parelaphostrongylus tenuis]|uniref:Uncharacterized protein n=1 Tax=Parelaphostrongylus tenuis TaxID=148309 RepID=A0AAD5R109_PARTN|nr:hypothetical protein KIN20_028546 [Parelaphostrongylus tenuis]